MAEEEDKKDEKKNSSGSSRFLNPSAKTREDEVAEANKKVDKINDLISELKSPGVSLARIMAIKKEIGDLISEISGIIDSSLLSSLKTELEKDVTDAISRETIIDMYLSSISDILSQEAQQAFEKKAKEMEELRFSSEALLGKFAKYFDPKTKEELDRLHKKVHRGERLTEKELGTLRNIPVPTEAELANIKNNREKLAQYRKELHHKCSRLQKAKEEAIRKHPHKKADIEKAIDPAIRRHEEEIEKTEKVISRHDELLERLAKRTEILERDRDNKKKEIEKVGGEFQMSNSLKHEQDSAALIEQELQKKKDKTFSFHSFDETQKEKEKFLTEDTRRRDSRRSEELHKGTDSTSAKSPEEEGAEHAAKILQKMAKFQPKKPTAPPNSPTTPDKGRSR